MRVSGYVPQILPPLRRSSAAIVAVFPDADTEQVLLNADTK